jgi:hypothetical protein
MGCQQSVPEKTKIFAVGGTERMASRAARVQTASTAATLSKTPNSVASSSVMHMHSIGTSNGVASNPSPPKLDAVGHLLPEEVVRRTSSAIKTKDVLLGMPDNPIRVQVCMVYVNVCVLCCVSV